MVFRFLGFRSWPANVVAVRRSLGGYVGSVDFDVVLEERPIVRSPGPEGVAVVAGIGLLGGLVFKAVEIAYQSPVAPTGNIMLDALNPPNVFAPVQNQKTSDNTGPKAADAAGVTAGGQATNKYGDKLGPSGEVQVNQARHSTEKGAKDAARQEGAGAPEKHVNPTKGGPHYHPTDKQGKKIPSSTHHNYPD